MAKKIAADLANVIATAELSDWFYLAHEHASSDEAGAHAEACAELSELLSAAVRKAPLGGELAPGVLCACSTKMEKQARLFVGSRQGMMLSALLVDDLGVGIVDGTLLDDELSLSVRYLTTPFTSAKWALRRTPDGWKGKRTVGEAQRAGGPVTITAGA
jgi:hypothetical protein